MSILEIAVILVAIIAIGGFLCAGDTWSETRQINKRLSDMNSALNDLRSNFECLKKSIYTERDFAQFEKLKPVFEEYAKLSGFVDFWKECDGYVGFGDSRTYGFHTLRRVRIGDVTDKLAELKKAIEIACPSKCAEEKKD